MLLGHSGSSLDPNMHLPSAKYLQCVGSCLGVVAVHVCCAMGAPKKSVVGGSRHRRRVAGVHVPVRTVWPWRWMVTVVASKNAVQSLSQSCPMEIRDPDVRVGKMCAVQASSGRKGIWRLAVWLDVMVLPSGSMMTRLGLAMILLEYGALMVR